MADLLMSSLVGGIAGVGQTQMLGMAWFLWIDHIPEAGRAWYALAAAPGWPPSVLHSKQYLQLANVPLRRVVME